MRYKKIKSPLKILNQTLNVTLLLDMETVVKKIAFCLVY
jgi:hypothetical protein